MQVELDGPIAVTLRSCQSSISPSERDHLARAAGSPTRRMTRAGSRSPCDPFRGATGHWQFDGRRHAAAVGAHGQSCFIPRRRCPHASGCRRAVVVGRPDADDAGQGRLFHDPAANTGRTYDISSDGQRFLMIKAPGGDSTASSPSVIVVQHFDEEFKAARAHQVAMGLTTGSRLGPYEIPLRPRRRRHGGGVSRARYEARSRRPR